MGKAQTLNELLYPEGLSFTRRLWRGYWMARYRVSARLSRFWHRAQMRFPRLVNEGAATALVVDMCFDGYPMAKDFATKEDAVRLLQSIWDVVDNWDGSRVNVPWSQGLKSNPSVYEWARQTTGQGS